MSMPAEIPPEVMYWPASTQRTPSMTLSPGKSWRRSAWSSQCVVAGCPSSRPALASRKAPVQTAAVIFAVPAVSASQRMTAGFSSSPVTTPPGTISRSIGGAVAKSWSGSVFRPARAMIAAACSATVNTSKGCSAAGCRREKTRLAVVKTSYGPAKSSTSTSGKTNIPTRVCITFSPWQVRRAAWAKHSRRSHLPLAVCRAGKSAE